MIKTDRECSALAPPEGKNRVTTAVSSGGNKGLSLEARAGAKSKSWIYRFYLNQKQHKMTLGSYPAMSLAQARVAHAEAVAYVKQGIDPRQVISEIKQKNQQMLILDELFEEWITHKETARRRNGGKPEISPRTAADYRNLYRNYLQNALGRCRVCDITMAMLHQHYKVVQRLSVEGLRKCMSLMNQMMDEAMRRQLIEMSPTLALKPKVYNATPGKPRERWLNIEELSVVWQNLVEGVTGGGAIAAGGRGLAASTVLSGSIANAIKLVILTAIRRGEAVSMQWAQIDGDRWTIPETKSGRAQVVTLCPLAQAILKEQRAIVSPTCPYVFESSIKHGEPITGDAMMRALDRLQKRKMAEHESFNVHDLRRSVATCCGIELGAGPLEIEHMLNHQISDKLLRTYQAGALRNPEKLKALFLCWGDYVQKHIAGPTTDEDNQGSSNVVQVNFSKR